jgi:hypothetical protein
MAALTPTPKQQIYGSDGNPLVGGKIYTYAAGTTTPLATYTDAGAGTANTNPIILNSLGQANIWLGSSSYKFSVYTSADVLLYTVDNISAPLDANGLALALSSPTPIGNTAPNTGAFTTLAATTGTITTVNSTTVNATTVNATTITATGTVTAETLTFEGGGSMTRPSELGIQPITATVASNALTVTLNPTTLDFRSTTLGSGTVTTVTLAAAASVIVPTLATLGSISGQISRIAVLAINNAGTIETAVVNILGNNDLSETGLISTTAISGSATASNVIYSTTARTSVAYRVVGYVESTQATAGTWATAPSTIQGQGGLALPESLIKTGVSVATTSGTSIDFTNIPNWVKRITIMCTAISTNGITDWGVQLGTSSGVEATGYTGGIGNTGSGFANSSTYIQVQYSTLATSTTNGHIVLTKSTTSNTWVSSSVTAAAPFYNYPSVGGSSKTLSGILDRIRLVTGNGIDTFDSGSVNILWE